MDTVRSSQKGKRKAPEGFNIRFKVIREMTNAKRQKYSLKVLKPDVTHVPTGREITYPTVYLKKERADNQHAFYIMHNLNHINILSMKALGKSKIETNNPLSVVAFVEPYDGLLWSKFMNFRACADRLNHIPSPKLQSFLRGIVVGLDFLWMRGLYHGNLNWDSTLYYQDTVKLAGFEELNTSKEEAQWNDVLCFIRMLEKLSESSINANQNRSQERYFCSHVDSLINLLKTLNQIPLSRRKDIILEHIFFWDLAKRVTFFVNDVSLLLSNDQFMQRLGKSKLCGKSWDKNGTPAFTRLVREMNCYRKSKRLGPYDGNSVEDYVRCICGAFTHWKKMKVDADGIVRGNHATIFSELRHITFELDNLTKDGSSVDLVSNKGSVCIGSFSVPLCESEASSSGKWLKIVIGEANSLHKEEGKEHEEKQCKVSGSASTCGGS